MPDIFSDGTVTVVTEYAQGPPGPPGTDGSSTSLSGFFLVSQASSGLTNALIFQAGSGLNLSVTGTTFTLNATGSQSGGSGTVTSVGLSAPSDLFTTGSAVTSSGNLSLTKVSQSSNLFYASPSGSAGVPIFRTATANDLASLFKVGTNMSIVGGTTLTFSATGLASQYASGTVTSVGLSLPNIFVTGTNVTSSGNLTATLANQASGLVFASPASGGTPLFRVLTLSDLPGTIYTTSYSNTLNALASGNLYTAGTGITISPTNVISNTATGSGTTYTSGPGILINGTVVSSFASAAVITTSNLSPLLTSTIINGTLGFTLNNQASGTFFSGPVLGASTTPTFRALASGDTYNAVAGNLAQGSNITLTKNPLTNTITIAAAAASGGGSATPDYSPGNTANPLRSIGSARTIFGSTTWISSLGSVTTAGTIASANDALGTWNSATDGGTISPVNPGAFFISDTPIRRQGKARSWAHVKLPSDITNARFWFNVFTTDYDSIGKNDAYTGAHYWGVRLSSGSGDTTFKLVTCDHSSVNVVDSTATAVAGNDYTFYVDTRDSSKIDLWVNGVFACTSSTSLPDATTLLYSMPVIVVTLENVAKTTYLANSTMESV